MEVVEGSVADVRQLGQHVGQDGAPAVVAAAAGAVIGLGLVDVSEKVEP